VWSVAPAMSTTSFFLQSLAIASNSYQLDIGLDFVADPRHQHVESRTHFKLEIPVVLPYHDCGVAPWVHVLNLHVAEGSSDI